jgi:hypothetical protein
LSTEPEIVDPNQDTGPHHGRAGKLVRAGIEIAGGAIPIFGGLLAAGASAWSEHEQDEVNDFLRAQMKMIEDELREKQRVLAEIIARLDLHDDEIRQRLKSDEYQRLLKKAFRNWAGTESQKKQEYVRNLLSNAAATQLVSDDVISLFLDWLQLYSEFHFAVVGEIYRNPGSTRGDIWDALGKGAVREDSAEADLFRLLIRDLSTGGVIRQHRPVDGQGHFLTQRVPSRRGTAPRTMKSAFDDKENYELTALGQQFVHYVMTELPIKIAYQSNTNSEPAASTAGQKENFNVE